VNIDCKQKDSADSHISTLIKTPTPTSAIPTTTSTMVSTTTATPAASRICPTPKSIAIETFESTTYSALAITTITARSALRIAFNTFDLYFRIHGYYWALSIAFKRMPDVTHIFAISRHRCMYNTVQFRTRTRSGRHWRHVISPFLPAQHAGYFRPCPRREYTIASC
jgi:hypothetical protein